MTRIPPHPTPGAGRLGGMALLLAVTLRPVVAAGQLPADSAGTVPLRRLSGVKVSASRVAAEEATGSAVQRLDTRALRERGVVSLADALQQFSGTYVRDYGGSGGLKTVSIHGLGAGHTVVTYGGLGLSDHRSGQVDLSRYNDIGDLAEVCIYTTDRPALLCPVRNLGAAVVSLDPLRPPSGKERFTQAAIETGSTGSISPSFHHARQGEAWSWNAGGRYLFNQGHYAYVVHNGVATERRHRRNSRMQALTLSGGAVRRDKGGGQLELLARAYLNRQELPGAVRLYLDNNDERMAEREALAQLRYRRALTPALRLETAAKYTWSDSRYTDPGAEYPGGCLRQNYRQHEAYATAGLGWRPAGWFEAAYATDVIHARMTSNLETDNNVWRTTWLHALSARFTAGAVSLTARLTGTLLYNGNAAAAERARNALRLTPWLTLGWQAIRTDRAGLALRAHYKETFRAPTFTECYYYHYGSPQVRPERAQQAGLGVTARFQPSARLAVTLRADVFGARITDRITSVPVTLNIWRTTNIGRVSSTGLEAEAAATVRPARNHRLEAGATYTLQRLRNATATSSPLQLPYTPRHVASARMGWINPWCNVALNLMAFSERWSSPEHTSGTRLRPYAELGATLWRQWALRSLRLTARAEAVNLTGTEYEIIKNYPMPRQQLRLTLTAAW